MKTGRLLCAILVALLILAAGCASEKTIVTEPKPSTVEIPQPSSERPVPKPALPSAAVKETPAEAPEITFEEAVHDFGEVGPSTSHTFDFKFSNTGNAVLKFDRKPHAPCGCTIPELEKNEYAPGESGVLKVRYNAPAMAAIESKPIYVYTNDPKSPQFELTIKAPVTVNVAVTPEDVSLLLDQPNAGMSKLTVKSKDGKAFAITSITTSNEVMQIPFDKNQRAAVIVLEPKVDSVKLQETPSGLIQIRTDHPQSGTLMVRYNAKPMFEVSRPRIILQNMLPGEEIIRDVWIRSNYNQKVQIESFSSANGIMSIQSQQEEGNHLQIMVKIVPPADASPAGRRYITDELNIHLTSGHDLTIRCSGWFKLN
jgi:hypothetical protein